MKTVIIKIILQLLTDEKTRHKILVAIASVIVGLLADVLLPCSIEKT